MMGDGCCLCWSSGVATKRWWRRGRRCLTRGTTRSEQMFNRYQVCHTEIVRSLLEL
jgi:hypothetical protein